jgi:S1-C subfamily serine protease
MNNAMKPLLPIRRIWFLATAAVVVSSLAIPAADPKPPLSGKDIFQRVLKSAVWIARPIPTGGGRVVISSGSGALIDATGRYVLTNYHVVGDSEVMAVFFPQYDGSKKLVAVKDHYVKQLLNNGGLMGKVVHREKRKDLAIIQLPSLPPGVSPLPLARESVGPGDSVHSIGNPGASGALWAYSPGSVKAVYPKRWQVLDRDRVMQFEAQVVETTSPVNPGDSGGPMVNNNAELVAVTQGGVTAQGTISYFIDLSEVRKVLAEKRIRIQSPSVASATIEPKSDENSEKQSVVAEADKQEMLAQNKLNFAEQYRDRPSRYKEKLQDVVKQFPDTKAAKQAKEILAKLR